MASFTAINQTAADPDLRQRLYAAAAAEGKTSPEVWVDQRIRQLASSYVDAAQGDTLADVYIFAVNRQKAFLSSTALDLWSGEVMLPPGLNPGACTDDHLRYILENWTDNQ